MFLLQDRTWDRRIIAACCVLLGLAMSALGQTSSPWAWGPHLGAVAPNSVAISWSTSRTVAIDLQYGLARVHDLTGLWDETLTLDQHEGNAEIWLTDLLPGETYRYQVVVYEGDAVFPSEVGTFETPSDSLRAFTFTAYGGTNSLSDRHRIVAGTMAQEEEGRPVFHLGDLIDASSVDPLASTFWAIDDLARTHPFLPIVGNRDTGQAAFYEAFALPFGGGEAQEQWWSFDYGVVHFVSLDSSLAETTSAAAQQQLVWVEQDLAAAQGQMIVILTHQPLYSAAYPSGVNTAWRDALEPLFRTYGVRLVLSGETHWYEHIYTQGIHHITSGGGGGPLAESPEVTVPGTVFRRVGLLHYMRLTVADQALQVEAVPVASVEGDVVLLVPSGRSVDSFVLRTSTP